MHRKRNAAGTEALRCRDILNLKTNAKNALNKALNNCNPAENPTKSTFCPAQYLSTAGGLGRRFLQLFEPPLVLCQLSFIGWGKGFSLL
jgi:hypothetical protein